MRACGGSGLPGRMLRGKLIKIGAKVVRHAKYVTYQLAEVAVPRDLFAAILLSSNVTRLNRSAASSSCPMSP